MTFLSSYAYLSTKELYLRPLTIADAPAIFLYTSDPSVAAYTHWEPHCTIRDSIAYIDHIQKLQTTHTWGITLQSTGALIGECSITLHEDGRSEIYYALSRAYWGHGYTSQAVQKICDLSQTFPAITRLEAWIIPANRASCRVAEKAGFGLEQTIPQAWGMRNGLHDIALYTRQNK